MKNKKVKNRTVNFSILNRDGPNPDLNLLAAEDYYWFTIDTPKNTSKAIDLASFVNLPDMVKELVVDICEKNYGNRVPNLPQAKDMIYIPKAMRNISLGAKQLSKNCSVFISINGESN